VIVIQPTADDLATRAYPHATQASIARQAHASLAAQLAQAGNAAGLDALTAPRDAAAAG
jgi:hypothetical protein